MDLESIKELIEIVENGDMIKQLNKAQKGYLKNNFNTYINFEYGEDANYILKMSNSSYKSFEYYLGMEYEKDYILTIIKDSNDTIVEYDTGCDRLRKIFEALEELEEE